MKYDYKVTAAGRVNIIGEHVDYCGGKVFPAALSMKNTVLVKANGGDRINLSWTTTDFARYKRTRKILRRKIRELYRGLRSYMEKRGA